MFQSKKLITANLLRAPKYYVNTSSYVLGGPRHQPNPAFVFQQRLQAFASSYNEDQAAEISLFKFPEIRAKVYRHKKESHVIKEYLDNQPEEDNALLIKVKHHGTCKECKKCMELYEASAERVLGETKLLKIDCQHGIERIDEDNQHLYDALNQRFVSCKTISETHLCREFKRAPNFAQMAEDIWNIEVLNNQQRFDDLLIILEDIYSRQDDLKGNLADLKNLVDDVSKNTELSFEQQAQVSTILFDLNLKETLEDNYYVHAKNIKFAEARLALHQNQQEGYINTDLPQFYQDLVVSNIDYMYDYLIDYDMWSIVNDGLLHSIQSYFFDFAHIYQTFDNHEKQLKCYITILELNEKFQEEIKNKIVGINTSVVRKEMISTANKLDQNDDLVNQAIKVLKECK